MDPLGTPQTSLESHRAALSAEFKRKIQHLRCATDKLKKLQIVLGQAHANPALASATRSADQVRALAEYGEQVSAEATVLKESADALARAMQGLDAVLKARDGFGSIGYSPGSRMSAGEAAAVLMELVHELEYFYNGRAAMVDFCVGLRAWGSFLLKRAEHQRAMAEAVVDLESLDGEGEITLTNQDQLSCGSLEACG